MESRWAGRAVGRGSRVVAFGPEGDELANVALSGERVSIGRLPGANDVALQPDPQQLVTRVAHCTFERESGRWFVVDGGGVNGTFLRRRGELERLSGRAPLQDGDVICVLASSTDEGERTFFELVFQDGEGDSQATRAVAISAARAPAPASACLHYDPEEARLVLVRGTERHDIEVRAQAHLLIRYMAERNRAIGGAPALCTHDELMHAVWQDEPMHTRAELAKLVWELRKKLEPFGAEHLVENERRRGYRLRTCPDA